MDTVEPNVSNGESQPEKLLLREMLFEKCPARAVRLGCGIMKKKVTKCAFFFFLKTLAIPNEIFGSITK